MKNTAIKYILLLLVTILALHACEYQFDQKIRQWNPYTKFQVLVFESTKNERDSIFINDIEEHQQNNNTLIKVNCELVNKNPATSVKTQSWLLTLTTTEHNKAVFNINLYTKTARLWPFIPKRTTWLDSLPMTKLEVYGTDYRDVLILEPDKDAEAYAASSSTDMFVEKIYWSKEHGLIRYDLKNGTVWNLVKKYSL
jgi:hypothetical protein